ncbi:tRNA lysidine(34) synthetase TilS [Winogradskyella aurantia]|uniref:tRNA(Ile)-lysidine synthase n=1 Tax=Winogradskyella aurantia TaxID=1915063 RepID=A0A265UXA2_9FLAO|nr:tRNA lysidine(34) synthetase TilS [Winogradskyella aurantia]OZV69945.1 tRNA lysidine(34) synthetase TilS [Winogradskyella aurantia]
MLKSFSDTIDGPLRCLKQGKLLLAISGGLDSVVLAWLCHELKLNFALAHCNFNLRDEESNTDEDFVINLAEDLDVEVFIQNFDTLSYAQSNGRSIQMAARELRYDWLKELAGQLEFDYILTAHHADDNLETFLINFTRGTGLNGLTGIPTINDNIVRPLLSFPRAQIQEYARDHNIDWREDSSNATRKYLRNKFRHDIVPILKEINPNLLDSFQNTLEHLKDTADIVEESLNAVAKRAIVNIDDHGVTYKISEFKKVNNPKAYLFEMFKNFGFTEWNDVVDLLDAESGKYVKSNSHRLIKHRAHLILTDLQTYTNEPIIINESDASIETPLGILKLETAKSYLQADLHTIYVDKHRLKFPLMLRPWQEGDIFQPLGMTGKKKVSKYLKDEKTSLVEKENTWVLTSDNEIIWIVGKRADERFKITSKTKDILKITLKG